MSSVVCQDLQTCFDSQIGESRVVNLRVLPAKPNSPSSVGFSPRVWSEEDVSGGWSSLQCLFENGKSNHDCYSNVPIVSMSDESLNMCTEILGNENGSAFTDSNTLFLSSLPALAEPKMAEGSSPPPCDVPSADCRETRQHRMSRKITAGEIPPPLTSMSGSTCLRILPHREYGRLVVEACHSPTAVNGFEIERTNGRVQLSIIRDSDSTFTAREALNAETDLLPGEDEVFPPEPEGSTDYWHSDKKPNDSESSRKWEVMEIGPNPEIEFEDYHRKPCRCKDGDIDKLFIWPRFSLAT